MANVAFTPNATTSVPAPVAVDLGDFAWVLPSSFSRRAPVVKLPRCTGIRIKDIPVASRLIVLVQGWATKIGGSDNPRSNVESYVQSLWKDLGGRKGKLTIDGDSYTNCVPVSCSPESEDSKQLRFAITFAQQQS